MISYIPGSANCFQSVQLGVAIISLSCINVFVVAAFPFKLIYKLTWVLLFNLRFVHNKSCSVGFLSQLYSLTVVLNCLLTSYSSLDSWPISRMQCSEMLLPSHLPSHSCFPEPKDPEDSWSFTLRIWALPCRATSAQIHVPRPGCWEQLIPQPTAKEMGHTPEQDPAVGSLGAMWDQGLIWFGSWPCSTIVDGGTICELLFYGLCWHSAVSQNPQPKQTNGLE